MIRFALLALAMASGSASAVQADPPPAPTDYFSQFIYVDDAAFPDTGKPATRYLMTWDGTPIAPDAAGVMVNGLFELFLLKDHTYVLKYTEVYLEPDMGVIPVTRPIPVLHYLGSWSVAGDQLLLGNIGVGAATTAMVGPGVALTFNQDLQRPGLKGKVATFLYCYSTATPWDP